MVSTAPDIHIFDRHRLRRNRDRCAKNLSEHSFLIDWAADQLADRLKDVTRDFPLALSIGAKNNVLPHAITLDCSRRLLEKSPGPVIQSDEEFLPIKESSLDLILSCLNLHSVNDLPGTLLQIRKSLKPDGLFLAALFGGETLHELRESLMQAEISVKGGASPRVFPLADKPQMGALLQRAGFSLPVVDSEIITVTYDNIFKLLADLRGMGESNIIRGRHKANPGRAFFMKAADHYQKHFSDPDGRIRASFEIIFLIGWAPHESQQKALRPGSAKTRLSHALNTEEIKTGEKAAP